MPDEPGLTSFPGRPVVLGKDPTAKKKPRKKQARRASKKGGRRGAR
jgi:hypothetical protein